MSDQNKSDWLAEHLLGWHIEGRDISASWHDRDGKFLFRRFPNIWQPHEEIEQCFAYLIPAMEDKGWWFFLENVVPNSDPVVYAATFHDGLLGEGKRFQSDYEDTPAAAIVDACFAALQKELK